MTKAPPLLPSETLERVLGRAQFNGTGVLAVGSVFALLGAAGGDIMGVMAWLLIAGTGAMTLHGATLLCEAQSRGMNWLVGGPVLCLAIILSLCTWQLTHVDVAPLRAAVTSEMQSSIAQTGMSEEQFLLLTYQLTYGVIATGAFLYQGGMALYYHRRRAAIAAAMEADPD